MKGIAFGFIFSVLHTLVFAQPVSTNQEQITKITGFAPKYIGKQIEIFEIVDYFSMKEARIATATVDEDSTFSCSFYLKETQKLIINSNNNKGFIYASPGATYSVYLPEKNPYDPYRPLGNNIELTFGDLDSTDINYKILEFNRWMDEFLAVFYTKNNTESAYFSKRLDTFKMNVYQYYLSDSNNAFFQTYVRFSIAKIDDLRFLGARNQFEKYDFYIKKSPVSYQNEAYINYIDHYYEKLLPRVNYELNNKIYLALLKSSPTLILKAMGLEYTLETNLRLRELIMIKTLSDAFYEKDYPRTNILTVLDSLAQFGGFEQNRIIAKNTIERLVELTPGGQAPDFTINQNNASYTLQTFKGKHLYLFFVKPESIETAKQVELLMPIYQRYLNQVRFFMVIENEGNASNDKIEELRKKVPWESVVLDGKQGVFSSYQVQTYPYFVLIDTQGYIVSAPALGATPNGQYETIDKYFFYIKKIIEEEKK